ncbi:lytic transglycosylase domain-containing protein [Suttonella ornithocola]|uniref:Membrane-bound lytic murein transglycosylase D n=1 Tax=Suttonella ornithocola TaxID=279832 RepID=A0A380MXK8_9GAMM|nr:transglycosylase SLT domain-containing protein [Suttonella ornithocola]SUO96633.1 membrane-bound lytic murein transglycosylase D [Suttonella ornithocola]
MKRVTCLLLCLILVGCFDDKQSSDKRASNSLTGSDGNRNQAQQSEVVDIETDNTEIYDDNAGTVSGGSIIISEGDWSPPPNLNKARPNVFNKYVAAKRKALAPMINRVAKREGVPALMLHALITQESKYQKHARSNVGAQGMVQIMPETFKILQRNGLKCSDPYHDECNVNGAAIYIKIIHKKVQQNNIAHVQTIASAYNAGEGTALSYLKGYKLKGKNPLGRKLPHGVPNITFGKGQTYDYAQMVAAYWILYKQNPELIGLSKSISYPSTEADRRDLLKAGG